MEHLLRETRRNCRAAKAHRSPKDHAGSLRRQGANHEFMFVAAGARMREAQKAWRRRIKANGTDAVIQQILTSRDDLSASMKARDGLELPPLDYGTVQAILAADEKLDIIDVLNRLGRKPFDALADKLDALAIGYHPAAFVRRATGAGAPQIPAEVYYWLAWEASDWTCREYNQLASALALLAVAMVWFPGMSEIFAVESGVIFLAMSYLC